MRKCEQDQIFCGDCLNILKEERDSCFDLIMTSPPYAGKRDGVSEKDYVPWFLERSAELKRVLKPEGSFVLNIKEGAIDGRRQLYVMKLVIAMVREQEWIFVDEYIWHKPNAAPGKWPNRFRDAWEHCYHFTKQKKFAMYQKEVMVPIGKWAIPRLKTLGKNDFIRHSSATGSGVARKVANWVDRNKVYPTNVLHLSAEASNQRHNAVFPEQLPTWFIKLFTKPNDIVLDPFVGSGTTCVAAQRLGRRYIGIDKFQGNCEIAQNRLGDQLSLHMEAADG